MGNNNKRNTNNCVVKCNSRACERERNCCDGQSWRNCGTQSDRFGHFSLGPCCSRLGVLGEVYCRSYLMGTSRDRSRQCPGIRGTDEISSRVVKFSYRMIHDRFICIQYTSSIVICIQYSKCVFKCRDEDIF